MSETATTTGVLVAVSNPIFTSQLKKARLATNQANARSAEAAMVAALLDQSKSYGSAEYDITTGTLGTITDVAEDAATLTVSSAPATWTVDTVLVGSDKAGDKTYQKWTVHSSFKPETPLNALLSDTRRFVCFPSCPGTWKLFLSEGILRGFQYFRNRRSCSLVL